MPEDDLYDRALARLDEDRVDDLLRRSSTLLFRERMAVRSALTLLRAVLEERRNLDVPQLRHLITENGNAALRKFAGVDGA